jgi:hypothetical protein
MDGVMDDIRFNARLEEEQHDAFLQSVTVMHSEHADAIDSANREMNQLWGRFRTTLLVFVACLLLTTAVHDRGGRQLAVHANNHTTVAFAHADRVTGNSTHHLGLRDPTDSGHHRHVAGMWERIVHFLFLVMLLRLAALRQRQMQYERALVDDDPFGIHGTNPFLGLGTIRRHWQPAGYHHLAAELDAAADDDHSRHIWWHRPAHTRRHYHDEFV